MTEPEVEMQRPPGTLQSSQYFGQPANDRGEVSSIFEMADDYKTELPLKKKKEKVEGTGGTLYIDKGKKIQKKKSSSEKKERQVWAALANLEADSTFSLLGVSLPLDA